MAKPKKFAADEVATAITNSKGILAQAARTLGCSRQTISNYIENFATVKAAFDESNETTIDFVESQLLKNINSGDTASIIFFLKTKGKRRGYVERQEVEHTGKDGGPIQQTMQHDLSRLSVDELKIMRELAVKAANVDS